jgi:hypothetical protein
MTMNRVERPLAALEAIALTEDHHNPRIIAFPIRRRRTGSAPRRLPMVQRLSLIAAAAFTSWMVLGSLTWGAVGIARHII